ncbi:hypothetical protein E2C01_045230 [Portunus trituberculatus]|uniref:Uncharacterized protein n=1 Tax=Portunus trituberculatus TaxID=210409 RepID=A0A5B7G1G2_PORTR|nr:hypothetical protein [Portunus trituberculatus]
MKEEEEEMEEKRTVIERKQTENKKEEDREWKRGENLAPPKKYNDDNDDDDDDDDDDDGKEEEEEEEDLEENSTMKVERPEVTDGVLGVTAMMASTGVSLALVAGTQLPTCASTTSTPTCCCHYVTDIKHEGAVHQGEEGVGVVQQGIHQPQHDTRLVVGNLYVDIAQLTVQLCGDHCTLSQPVTTCHSSHGKLLKCSTVPGTLVCAVPWEPWCVLCPDHCLLRREVTLSVAWRRRNTLHPSPTHQLCRLFIPSPIFLVLGPPFLYHYVKFEAFIFTRRYD